MNRYEKGCQNDKMDKHWSDCSKSKSGLCKHYLQKEQSDLFFTLAIFGM